MRLSLIITLIFSCLMASAQRKPKTAKIMYICDSAQFSYTAKSSVAGAVNFSWSRVRVEGIANETGAGTGATIAEVLDNTTALPITVKYAVTMQANGCDHTDTIIVVVKPSPRLTSDKHLIICDSAQFSYTATASVLNTSFAWYRPQVRAIANDSASWTEDNFSNRLVLKENAITRVPYYVKMQADGCEYQDSVVVSLIYRPYGAVALNPVDTVLAGDPVEVAFKTSDTMQLKYNWSFGDGRVASGSMDKLKHYYNGRDSIVRFIALSVTNNYGCTRDFSSSIYVKGDNTPRPKDTIAVERNYRMMIYPIPFRDDLWLQYTLVRDQAVTIGIHDLAGRLLHTEKLVLQAGARKIKLPVQSLTRGVVYVLRVYGAGISYEEKFYKR